MAGVALVAVSALTTTAATAMPARAATARLAAMPPANAVDPGVPGTFRTVEGEYDLPPVSLPEMAQAVEMHALVIAPKGGTTKRPLVVFLHGRQDACYTPGADEFQPGWPCPAGSRPVLGTDPESQRSWRSCAMW
jgi:hypothetical protein